MALKDCKIHRRTFRNDPDITPPPTARKREKKVIKVLKDLRIQLVSKTDQEMSYIQLFFCMQCR